MKFLLEVGHQLDLNVNWDGGGVDNVTYQVSAGSEDVISVTSAGIVEGLMAGVGVVEFFNSNVVVGSAIFEVLTAAEMISRQALRDGTSTLVVDADAVAVTPTYTLVTGGTARSGGNYAFPVDHAFDGIDATYWESLQTFNSVTNWDCFIGKEFSAPKQIKKITVKWRIPPTEVDVLVVDNSNPWGATTLMTIPVVYSDTTVEAYMQSYDIILPAYAPKTAIYLRPKTSTAVPGTYWAANGGIIDRFRVTQLDFYE